LYRQNFSGGEDMQMKSTESTATTSNITTIMTTIATPSTPEITNLPVTTPAMTTPQKITSQPSKFFPNYGAGKDLREHPNFRILAGRHCGFGTHLRISNGKNVKPGELPWIVMIQYRGK
jgi:hypothetical protein